jgi:hypothetical protein
MLELVTWRDAWFEFDQPEDRDDYLVETVGWVTEDDVWLHVTAENTPDGPRAVSHIPKVLVVNRRIV